MSSSRRWSRFGFFLLVALPLVLTGEKLSGQGQPAPADANQVFAQMAKAIGGLTNYQAEWTSYSTTVGPRPIWSRSRAVGKFVRQPPLYWEKIQENENNFHDPTKPGTQLIYDSRVKEIQALLPGTLRMIGVVHIFLEDVKCLEMYGNSLATAGLWDMLAVWQSKLKTGKLSLRAETYHGKNLRALTLTFSVQSFGERKSVNRYEIWVDPVTHLPRRLLGFVEGVSKPVWEMEYLQLTLNPGLKPEDIKFEGLALWSFPAQFVANAKGLENLRFQPLATASGTPVPPDKIQAQFSAALSKIKDYRAEFTLTQKYFRLKSKGKVILAVIREPRAFLFEFDPDLRINYLHLMSAGGKLCYRREDFCYAAMGGGAMRAAGVEVMHVEDRRADFPCGESFYGMNFFELEKKIKWFSQHGKISSDLVTLAGKTCPRLLLQRTTEPVAGEIQDLNVIFSPETWLPLRIEYLGNLDQQGFTLLEFQSVKTNLGFKEADLRF